LAPLRLFWDNQMAPELDKSLSEISGRDHVAPRLEDSGVLERNSFAVMDYSYWPLLGIYLRRFQQGHMFSVQNMWNVRTTSVYQGTAMFGTAAAIFFVGAIAAAFLIGISNEKADLEAQKKRVESQIVALEATTRTMKAEREKAARLRRNVLKQAVLVSSVKQFSWANVFTYINRAIPEDVWLKSFSLHRSGQVSLVGTGLNMDAVAKLLRGLERNDKLARVEMKSTSQRKLENIDVVDFNITAMLVPSVQEKK
jgi:Tfp pilus assembly protein PilN